MDSGLSPPPAAALPRSPGTLRTETGAGGTRRWRLRRRPPQRCGRMHCPSGFRAKAPCKVQARRSPRRPGCGLHLPGPSEKRLNATPAYQVFVPARLADSRCQPPRPRRARGNERGGGPRESRDIVIAGASWRGWCGWCAPTVPDTAKARARPRGANPRSQQRRGGSASKWPVEGAGSAAGMDGPSKTPAGVAAHTRLDAGKRTPAPTAPWKTGTRTPVSHTPDRPRRRGIHQRHGTATAPLSTAPDLGHRSCNEKSESLPLGLHRNTRPCPRLTLAPARCYRRPRQTQRKEWYPWH